jgi:Ca2+-binding RTX toxin-like protein
MNKDGQPRCSLRHFAALLVPIALFVSAAGPASAADPVIAAAGDIACSSTAVQGDSCHMQATSNLIVGAGLSAVLPLGDLQYQSGSLSDFRNYYDKSWGRVNPIVYPAPGNHEYLTSGANGYFDYFNGPGAPTGRAGDRSKGYYSFDVGTWHLIALNSNDHCQNVACGKGSPQETWLRADLAAHPTSCTLAYWHHPRFNSGYDGSGAFMQAIFQDLYDANAEVVLAGHAHDYERFAPQSPQGRLDRARGVRQFVVGTGGAFHTGLGSRVPNSEVRNDATFGVLMLTLHPTSYDWRFVAESGKPLDSGGDVCHGVLPPPVAAPAPSPSVQAGPPACTIVGTSGRDVLRGTAGNDVICADGGRDRIRGRGGDDVIRGGDGRDWIAGGKGNDQIYGQRGNDALHGQSGNDTIVGGGGRNRLYGGPGDDLLITSLNRRAADRAYGGAGHDVAEANRGDLVRSAARRRAAG